MKAMKLRNFYPVISGTMIMIDIIVTMIRLSGNIRKNDTYRLAYTRLTTPLFTGRGE